MSKFRFSDFVRFQRGVSWSAHQEHAEPGAARSPVLRIPNIQEHLHTRDLVYLSGLTDSVRGNTSASRGWLLLVGSNGNPERIGNAVLIEDDNDYLFASFLVGLKPDEKLIFDRYLLRLLLSEQIRSHLRVTIRGSTGLQNINLPALANFEVELPPLAEQRRVAEVLDALDDQILATEQIIAKLKFTMVGYSEDVFTGPSNVGWTSMPLGELLEHLIDYRGRTPRKLGMDWGGGEILALSANNVQMGGINTSKEAYFGSEELFARWMTNGRTRHGDILMTLEAPLGNIAQVPDDAKYILSQRVVMLRFDKDRFLNEFAYWYLQSERFQRELVRHSTGTTASGIRRASLEKLRIPTPSLQEQEVISDMLFAFESKIRVEERELAKLRQQKEGLVSDLLTARVRFALAATP